MALSGYAALLAWAGAALAVYAAAAVASSRGWVRAGFRLQAPVMLLTWLLVQRATAPKPGRSSRGPEAAGVEADAGRSLRGEAFVWLPVTAVCVLGLALTACVAVEAVMKRRLRVPVPPCVPATARRYSERRRA
uniref:Integral membrane protein n=1 Tax=Arundo donax TaxID=35708 RepID=A0A0A8ZAU5_ARUDO